MHGQDKKLVSPSFFGTIGQCPCGHPTETTPGLAYPPDSARREEAFLGFVWDWTGTKHCCCCVAVVALQGGTHLARCGVDALLAAQVYMLGEDGHWDDRGTGYVHVEMIQVAFPPAFIFGAS